MSSVEDDGEAEDGCEAEYSADGDMTSQWDMSQLARRISSVQDSDQLERRLEALDSAWVLVFDADTDEEAVYSMEMAEEQGAHVVLAFECVQEARLYAETLKEEEFESDATVQALDVAALVITSREADFRVGVVFKGDLEADTASTPLIMSGVPPAPERLSLSITMVPDHVFAGRSSDEFLDPAEDPVWVLVHDEGTSDAQFFSMTLNGTASIVCFKDAEAAERCSSALIDKGTAVATTRSMLLEELLDSIADDNVEVCLVDEVVESLFDEDEDGALQPGIVAADADDEVLGTFPIDGLEAAQQTSVAPSDVRDMLNRLYDAESGDEPGDAAESQ